MIAGKAVLITGSREWPSSCTWPFIVYLNHCRPDIAFHGAARGADTVLHHVCGELGVVPHPMPAAWPKYGYRAGAIRNEEMLQELLSFRDVGFDIAAGAFPLPGCRGTLDMASRLLDAQVYTHVFNADTGLFSALDMGTLHALRNDTYFRSVAKER
jgi:hypothetical protein